MIVDFYYKRHFMSLVKGVKFLLIRVKRPIIWITFAYVMGILAGIAVNKS